MIKNFSDNNERERIFKDIHKHFLIFYLCYEKSFKKEIKENIINIFGDEDIKIKKISLERSSECEKYFWTIVTLENLNDAENLFEKKIQLNLDSLKKYSNNSNLKLIPCKVLTKFFETSPEKLKYFHKRGHTEKYKLENNKKIIKSSLPDENQVIENQKMFPSIKNESSSENKINSTNLNQDVKIEFEENDEANKNLAKPSTTIIDVEKEEISQILLAEDNEEQIMLRTCYILNVPFIYRSNKTKVIDDLKKKNIAYPDEIKIVNYIDPSSNCFYLKIMFPDDTMVELLLERGLEFEKYPGLVLPCLKENTMEDLLVFHQAFVKSLNNEFSSESFDLKLEFEGLFRFFSTFGRIVDFNMEYFPNLIAITYVSSEAVQELVKLDEIAYYSIKKKKVILVANYHQPPVPVRNLKLRNESLYDCYLNKADLIKEEIIKAEEFKPVTCNADNSAKCNFLERSKFNSSDINKSASHVKSDLSSLIKQSPNCPDKNIKQNKDRTTCNSEISNCNQSSQKFSYDNYNVGDHYLRK